MACRFLVTFMMDNDVLALFKTVSLAIYGILSAFIFIEINDMISENDVG